MTSYEHGSIILYNNSYNFVALGILSLAGPQDSPLLVAAQNGRTKCVTLLLQKGANVFQTDSEDRNCLMLAIQNQHKYEPGVKHGY